MTTTWTAKRAKLAALSRHRPADDPEVLEAARDLRAARLEDHVAKVVALAPPLSDDQRARITRLLRGSGGDHE